MPVRTDPGQGHLFLRNQPPPTGYRASNRGLLRGDYLCEVLTLSHREGVTEAQVPIARGRSKVCGV